MRLDMATGMGQVPSKLEKRMEFDRMWSGTLD